MPLPASFLKDGFSSLEEARKVLSPKGKKLRRLMIGTDGPSDSGKTEFALSAPGPGMILALDRGIDGVLDNPEPPPSRNPNFGMKIIKVPLVSQLGSAQQYLEYWKAFYDEYKKATDNPDCRTVIIDGDSDSWELQKLAEFGKLTQIPPILYTNVNAARRAMYARAYDSGKIIIATNKIKNEYVDETDPITGKPILVNGQPKRVKSGEMERQGFPDQDYLFMIQLRHMYKPPHIRTMGKREIEVPGQFGIRLMKCKPNMSLIDSELWGEKCNFRGLIEHVFPNVDPAEFGLES